MRKLSEQMWGKFLSHTNRLTSKTKITYVVIQECTCNFYGMAHHTTTDNFLKETRVTIYLFIKRKKNVLRQTKLQILFLSLTIKIKI